MNDPLTLSGPHLSPVLSFPAVPWLLRSGVCLAWQLWKRHGSCFLSTGIVPGIVPTSWNSPHLIVIDSELSLSKSPYYMWESECSNSSSWHFTHGSWGDASVAEMPSEQTWGHGFEPQNLPKVWTQWQICDPSTPTARRAEAGDSPKTNVWLSWCPHWQTTQERSWSQRRQEIGAQLRLSSGIHSLVLARAHSTHSCSWKHA